MAEDIPILGQSGPLLDLLDQVSKAAPLARPVLVIGERGTGKELIANRLHFLSRRWDQPFIKINCAAIPETLIESELFGHEAGAFTGAVARRAGRFELADGGTLFLDEISALSSAAQEKLLRVIEYEEFERVGGSETVSADVRVVGATNEDLPSLARDGKFRADLLDRLAFDVLTLPPLRGRKSDIPELSTHFGRAMARDLGWESFPGFTPKVEQILIDHDWPGNVRELKNVVERAVYRAGDEAKRITAIEFDPFDHPWRPTGKRQPVGDETVAKGEEGAEVAARQILPPTNEPFVLRDWVGDYEKRLLEEALEQNRWNQRDTAEFLSLSYDQLRHALKKHGLIG